MLTIGVYANFLSVLMGIGTPIGRKLAVCILNYGRENLVCVLGQSILR